VIRRQEMYQDHYLLVENLVNTLRATYPGQWKISKLYATHLINIGDVRKASTVYKAYLKDSLHQTEAYEQVIGMESYLKESPDSILKYCNAALPIFKDSINMLLLISNVYAQHDDMKGAVKIANQCFELATEDSTRSAILGYIGDMYQTHNNLKTTYKYYTKALKYNSENIVVLNNYSYFLSEENTDLEKALTMSSLVVSKEPDNAIYIDTYGWILYKLGRYDDAKTAIRRAIALDKTNSPELLIHMGDIFLALGDTLSSEMYWKRALTNGAEKDKIDQRIAKLKQQ
ncbi:MAG: tetratricopeptide repeat protein, partial [Rikenellaceae bacterium]